MHGLINRALECFVRDTHGQAVWLQIARDAGLPHVTYEAMLTYDFSETVAVLTALCRRLGRPIEDILEDSGLYLVSHPNTRALRRLLRFGGGSFVEFLHTLDELPDWARMAVDDLELPALQLCEQADGRFTLLVHFPREGFGWVIMGLLRAMADDYGALVILSHEGFADGVERIGIELIEAAHSRGRQFSLGAGGA